MDNKNELYFCPPKLTSQYRIFLWDFQDLFLGLFVVAAGFLWFGLFVAVIGALILLLKAYVNDEKSIYLVLKAIFLYVFTSQTYSQYES